MNNQQQIETITLWIPELTINECDEGGFGWTFRCLDSDEEGEDIFSSPLEALANFTMHYIVVTDNMFKITPDKKEYLS